MVLFAAACSATPVSNVDSGAASGTSTTASLGGTTVTRPNDTALSVAGTTTLDSTTVAGGADATTTTVPGAVPGQSTVPGGGVVTTAAPVPTTNGGGGGSPTTPAPTTATTAKATTTTTVPKPTLVADGSNNTLTVHCMGPVTSAMASATWSTTNATQVAVALGQVADAFSAPINADLSKTSGSYPVTLTCPGPANQYTTVTAMGPGGKTTVVITWTMHVM